MGTTTFLLHSPIRIVEIVLYPRIFEEHDFLNLSSLTTNQNAARNSKCVSNSTKFEKRVAAINAVTWEENLKY